MHSLLDHLGIGDGASTESAIDLIDEELDRCKKEGDWLGYGEWCLLRAQREDVGQREGELARATAVWASPQGLILMPESLRELADQHEQFQANYLATAVVAVAARLPDLKLSIEADVLSDLAYRTRSSIASIYRVEGKSPRRLLEAASARYAELRGALTAAVASFSIATPATSRTAAAELVKRAHAFRPFSLVAERSFLGELDSLLGSGFRQFSQACEENSSADILRLGASVRSHAIQAGREATGRSASSLWQETTRLVALKLIEFADKSQIQTEETTRPHLQLTSHVTKLDLKHRAGVSVTAVLRNSGPGRVDRVSLESLSGPDAILELVEPSSAFTVDAGSEQTVKFSLRLERPRTSIDTKLTWSGVTMSAKPYSEGDRLLIEQQLTTPDWEHLRREPPYSLNPIRQGDRLIGRGALLDGLVMNALGGTSTFLWGQKRVGKTSVVQVLQELLEKRSYARVAFFRAGELAPLNEAEIGHTILTRLSRNLVLPGGWVIPSIADLRSGLGSIVPLVDDLVRSQEAKRFVVIVDEFDDLNTHLYTGERGRLFMSALRSLSETGVTFFFAGSERMRPIYVAHQQLLNKWSDVSLDTLESHEDRRAVILNPVSGSIEFDEVGVERLVTFCGGNPFYTNVLCSRLFQICAAEERTFIPVVTVEDVIARYAPSLGESAFAHLWEDNPDLDAGSRERLVAENCIALRAASALGGQFGSVEELLDVIVGFGLTAGEQVSDTEVGGAVARLKSRRVIVRQAAAGKWEVNPPVFAAWLAANAELQLLARWKEYAVRRKESAATSRRFVDPEVRVPIPEEELLEVAKGLAYCGKQKDVAEIRRWLRQFDDDVRIQLAFLLLRRLAERGFISGGAKLLELERIEQSIEALRQSTGGKWREVRGRRENLCIANVDGESKSGASTARELANRLRPAKRDHLARIDDWVRRHLSDDALLVVVDDFAGSGETIVRGIRSSIKTMREEWQTLVKDGRVACCLLFSFAEARRRIQQEFPDMKVLTARVFDEGLMAFDPGAGIFESDAERALANEMAVDVGEQLYAGYPLGVGRLGALVCFDNAIPNNTLPVFWSSGSVRGKQWTPLFPRA
jgi:hypothetical protein